MGTKMPVHSQQVITEETNYSDDESGTTHFDLRCIRDASMYTPPELPHSHYSILHYFTPYLTRFDVFQRVFLVFHASVCSTCSLLARCNAPRTKPEETPRLENNCARTLEKQGRNGVSDD